jgi:hypothetical protein
MIWIICYIVGLVIYLWTIPRYVYRNPVHMMGQWTLKEELDSRVVAGELSIMLACIYPVVVVLVASESRCFGLWKLTADDVFGVVERAAGWVLRVVVPESRNPAKPPEVPEEDCE